MDGWRRRSAIFICCSLLIFLSQSGYADRSLYRVDDAGRLHRIVSGRIETRPDMPCYVMKLGDCRWAFALDGEDRLVVYRGCGRDKYKVDFAITAEEITAANAVLDVTPLDDGRVMVDLHVNPSTAVDVEVDLARRRHRVFVGVGFEWDPTKKHVAYFRNARHFSRDANAPTELYVDHQLIKVFPRRTGERIQWQTPNVLSLTLRHADDETETVNVAIKRPRDNDAMEVKQ